MSFKSPDETVRQQFPREVEGQLQLKNWANAELTLLTGNLGMTEAAILFRADMVTYLSQRSSPYPMASKDEIHVRWDRFIDIDLKPGKSDAR